MTLPDIDLAVSTLSSVSLASVLDQSVDCVKLIGLDGDVQYMNSNGLCAMEVDDFSSVSGKCWADLWPDEAREMVLGSLADAASGHPVRFRAFCPTAKGSPRWWDVTVSSVADMSGEHAGFLSISRDVTENQQARDALEIAAAELKHRLKNTYTTISSLLLGFARGNANNEVFAQEMANRLVALSTAQALFASSDAPCDIRALIPALLQPFDNPACPVFIHNLPPASIDQGRADAIALVVGELSVNSAKHGALGHGGELHVDALVANGVLAIHWKERSDIKVEHHARNGGQGLRLMERIMRARKGAIALDWQERGLTVKLTFPLG